MGPTVQYSLGSRRLSPLTVSEQPFETGDKPQGRKFGSNMAHGPKSRLAYRHIPAIGRRSLLTQYISEELTHFVSGPVGRLGGR